MTTVSYFTEVFTDPEYVEGYRETPEKESTNGKCPVCHKGVWNQKARNFPASPGSVPLRKNEQTGEMKELILSFPPTPGRTTRVVFYCPDCEKILRVFDYIDGLATRGDELVK